MEKPTRLFDFIYYQQAHYPQARAFGYFYEGAWKFFSTDDIIEQARKMSQGLLELGLQPGDKVALVTYKNRPEWTITDLAMLQIGLINVPVYPTISAREYEYIFNDAGVKYCFCGAGDLVDKVKEAQTKVPSLQVIYSFDRRDDVPYWKDMWADDRSDELDARMAAVGPDDLATLIYTSGTTSIPKGVMLTHHNIVSNVTSVLPCIPVEAGQTALSFLPLCHIFERAVMYAYSFAGVNVVFTGTDNLGGETGDLRTVRPQFFTTVPRLLEKVYEKIYQKGLELSGVKKALFFWALRQTEDYEYDIEYRGLKKIKMAIADKLIFSKWREALGGRVKGIITGAAACPPRIAQVFSAAGIPVREGYGLTETSPALTINRFEPCGALLGTVGPPVDGVELRIESSDEYGPGEGEILAHGPNVMKGYYNKPEETAAVFTEINGKRFFRTGDVGKFVEHCGKQFLKITDRKKELLKTSGGKYVAPAPIENKLKEHFLVEQVMVVGEKRKFVSAIIVPAEEALRNWSTHNAIEWTSLELVVRHPRVIEKYQRIVDEINPLFSHIEQIKKFVLVPDAWEPIKADGSEAELTPTMKLKRRVILKKYAELIDQMYAE